MNVVFFLTACVCVCVIPPSTVKTAFVEERVEVALRHLLFCVCECVCLTELNVSFSLLK